MIMPLRVFDDQGNAEGFTIARAVRYAVQHGANVINMSFGMTSASSAVKQAIKFAIEHDSDWNQAGFAAGWKLKQSNGAWSFPGGFTTGRLSRISLAGHQGQKSGQHYEAARRQV